MHWRHVKDFGLVYQFNKSSTRSQHRDLTKFSLRINHCKDQHTLVLDEAEVGQLLVAHLAGEALRVPGGHHGLDDAADDELAWNIDAICDQYDGTDDVSKRDTSL